MCKPELADSLAVVAIAVGRNEIELASIGEILDLARVDSLIPDCLEGKRGGRAKVGIATDVCSLCAIAAVNALIAIELPPARADQFYEIQIEFLEKHIMERAQVLEQLRLLAAFAFDVILIFAAPPPMLTTRAPPSPGKASMRIPNSRATSMR